MNESTSMFQNKLGDSILRSTPLDQLKAGKSALSRLPSDKRLNFPPAQQSIESAEQTAFTQGFNNNNWGTLHEFLGKLFILFVTLIGPSTHFGDFQMTATQFSMDETIGGGRSSMYQMNNQS